MGADISGVTTDILNPLGLTPAGGTQADLTIGGASVGGNEEISVGGVLASLAMSLGPTLLFLSRTPAVVQLMDDLNNPNEEE